MHISCFFKLSFFFVYFCLRFTQIQWNNRHNIMWLVPQGHSFVFVWYNSSTCLCFLKGTRWFLYDILLLAFLVTFLLLLLYSLIYLWIVKKEKQFVVVFGLFLSLLGELQNQKSNNIANLVALIICFVKISCNSLKCNS